MTIRSLLLVSVGAVLLAAGAAVAGATGTKKPPEVALVETAYRELTAGRSADAIASYTQAIESQSLPAELLANALLNRALANQNLGNHAEAIDDYSAAIRMDAMSPPLRAVVLYNRGLSQQQLERPALAVEDFTGALLLDPELAQAYLSRANVLRQTGQYLFALGDYEKALRYSHAEPHLALYGQALTYEALNRPLLAQNALARAIKVSPDFQPARTKLLAMGGADAVSRAADGQGVVPEAQRAGLAVQRDELMTASLASTHPDVAKVEAELPSAVEPPPALRERDGRAPQSQAGVGDAEPASRIAKIEPTGKTSEVAALPAGEPEPEPERERASAQPQPERERASAQPQPESERASAQPQPALEGWMVQLSSQRNEASAWSAWDQLSKRHAELLGGRDAAVVRAELDGRGVFYRLRIHRLQSRSEAQSLCSRLKARGTSCYYGRAEG